MSSAAVSICRCRSRRAVQRDAVRFLRCVLQNQETVPSHLFFARLFSGRLQTVWDARRPVTPLLRTHGLVVTRGASIALVSKFLLARGSRTTKFSRIRSVCVLVMIGAPGPLPYP